MKAFRSGCVLSTAQNSSQVCLLSHAAAYSTTDPLCQCTGIQTSYGNLQGNTGKKPTMFPCGKSGAYPTLRSHQNHQGSHAQAAHEVGSHRHQKCRIRVMLPPFHPAGGKREKGGEHLDWLSCFTSLPLSSCCPTIKDLLKSSLDSIWGGARHQRLQQHVKALGRFALIESRIRNETDYRSAFYSTFPLPLNPPLPFSGPGRKRRRSRGKVMDKNEIHSNFL